MKENKNTMQFEDDGISLNNLCLFLGEFNDPPERRLNASTLIENDSYYCRKDRIVKTFIGGKWVKPLPVVSQPITMIGMIQHAAADPNTDVAKMETLWRMKQEIDAKEAETAFNLAMGIAQSQMTFIQNDCYNPQTKSRYASYKQLDKALRPLYTSNGFALSFNIEPTSNDDLINVICYVTHKEGHSRTYSIPMPNDGKGPKGNPVMTKAHATGGASTYGMRYLLKMIFNVAVGEEDFDGNDTTQQEEVKLLTENQQNTIHSMIVENDLSMSIFMGWIDSCINGVGNISDIPAIYYNKIIEKLNDSIKSKNK